MSEQDQKISNLFTELTALRIVLQELVARRALDTNNPQLFIENLKTASINDLSHVETFGQSPHHDDAIRNDIRSAVVRLLDELRIPRKSEAAPVRNEA
ncbi:hypothetical protein ACUSIJ_21675 [Pseudochelatococcus sp. B33]